MSKNLFLHKQKFNSQKLNPSSSDTISGEQKDPVQIDFLGSYYNQDGSHSPVTGGKGTEELSDHSGLLVVNIPLNKKNIMGASYGIEYYSSASTDNINFVVSSASAQDTRQYGNISYTLRNNAQTNTISFHVGGSTEYDVKSTSGGISYLRKSKNGNSTLGFNTLFFYDKWLLFYPVELRIDVIKTGKELVASDNRQVFNLGVSFSQVITKKMQAFLTAEIVYQKGLLSTPFHRVYFLTTSKPKVEQLPDKRIKYPLGLKLNYYFNDWLISRFYYRFYYDDFNIYAHTIELELPIKINSFFSIFPFYRLHLQTSSSYFKPYKEHTIDEIYYSSDYDLSELSSHKYGLGLRYSPLYGIFRLKIKDTRLIQLKSLDLRYASYRRSDGLNAFIISTALSFTIP